MPEEIKVLDRSTPAIIIWNLMCTHAKPESFDMEKVFPGFKANGYESVVQVELTVNGVPLPVMDTLNEYWRKSVAELDQRARNFAFEKIKDTRLQTVMDRLSALEHEINDELDKLFPGTSRDWD